MMNQIPCTINLHLSHQPFKVVIRDNGDFHTLEIHDGWGLSLNLFLTPKADTTQAIADLLRSLSPDDSNA